MDSNDTKPDAQDDSRAHDQDARADVIRPPAQYDATQEGVRPSTFDEALAALITDPKRYGAAVIFRLATAWAREQIARTTAANRRTEEEAATNRKLTEQLTLYRERVAGLESAESQRKKHRPLVTLVLVAAPIIFAIGLDATKSGHPAEGAALIIAALAFLGAAIYVEYFGARS